MAAFLSISSREVSSKIISIWFPTMTFTAIGGEHVVANMFYIPLGIFLGAPKVTVGMYIWKSMLPSALGNVLGGGLFVGTLYWYLYLTSEEGQQHHETTNHGNTSEHTFDGSVIKGANVLTLENSPA
jgi:formate/nitrite transporter FocA (FNT family)